MTVPYDQCVKAIATIFEKAGLAEDKARQQAELFVSTEARGVWSHGVGLTLKYTEQFLKKTICTEPSIRQIRCGASAAVLDGDRGLGVAVVQKGVEVAMEMALETGVGCVTITNLNHYAAGMYYADLPIRSGMMFTMMANSPCSMAPYGGGRKYFGTNPLTFAAPMGGLPAYCLDMASSVCAGNKLENAMNLGQPVPEGMGLDRHGAPCTDPAEILRHGSLLPFGGAKGSGIAGMVNLLAGVLSGGAFQDDVISLCRDTQKPANFGCFIQVLDIAKWMDYQVYSHRTETWGREILALPPAPGFQRVVYPGFLEEERRLDALANGLHLSDISVLNLEKAGKLVGVDALGLLQEINCA